MIYSMIEGKINEKKNSVNLQFTRVKTFKLLSD